MCNQEEPVFDEELDNELLRARRLPWQGQTLGSMGHNELLLVVLYLHEDTRRKGQIIARLSEQIEEMRRYVPNIVLKQMGLPIKE